MSHLPCGAVRRMVTGWGAPKGDATRPGGRQECRARCVAPPWGAHPSSSAADVQSGCGWVHITAMLEDIEKTVLRGSTFPAQPHYAPGHRSAHRLGRRLAAVERGAGWSSLPGVLE